MRGNRKNWAEGFMLGLLVGVVATVSYLAVRPAPANAGSPRPRAAIPVRLTGRDSGRSRAMLLAESPSSSVH